MVPDGIVDAEPDEPAEQQVVVDLLHQLPLGAHRVERLQQRGAQQTLRRDRLPPRALVELGKAASSEASTSFTISRIVRSGCLAGTRSSRST